MEVRTLERRDLATVADWFGNIHDVVAWAGPAARFPLTELELETMLATQTLDGRPCMTFAVAFDTGATEAQATFGIAIDEASHRATLARIALAPRLRGRRLGTALVRYAIDLTFAKAGATSIDLNVFVENDPAIAAYHACGFAFAPGAREACVIAGRTWHLAKMILERPTSFSAGPQTPGIRTS